MGSKSTEKVCLSSKHLENLAVTAYICGSQKKMRQNCKYMQLLLKKAARKKKTA